VPEMTTKETDPDSRSRGDPANIPQYTAPDPYGARAEGRPVRWRPVRRRVS
jgi:hypothetical protein